MAVVTSGNITASPAINGVAILTFMDTSTGLGTIISRVLVITDVNGIVVDTVNMGTSRTATYDITADQYLVFTETIVDNNGGPYTLVIKDLSTIFYDPEFANTIAQLGCSCNCGSEQLQYTDISLLFRNAAIIMGSFGNGSAAQTNITIANTIISGVLA